MGKFNRMFRTPCGWHSRIANRSVLVAVALMLALAVPARCSAQQVRLDANGIVGVEPTSRVDRLDFDSSLGRYAQLLDETPGHRFTLTQARAELARGAFRQSNRDVPNLGNNAPPLWLHLNIDNTQTTPHDYRIYVAENWADKVDAWLLGPDGHIAHWQFGIDRSPSRYLRPGLGFGFDTQLPPGHSELFIRADSVDSVALALRIVPMSVTGQLEGDAQDWLGVVHGFLLALVVTFGLLWLSLRETSLLRYVTYVSCYLYMHLAYSGIAARALWPDSPHVARYAIVVGMALFASAGIWFARDFLDLRQWSQRLDRCVAWLVRVVLLAMAVSVAADLRAPAISIAFAYILLFTVLMVGLGGLALRNGREQSRIFLTASLASMAGAFITTLAVMGILPFSELSFRAVEVGVMTEASIWALALGLRLRRERADRVRAQQLAEHDSLTGLYNRRGFLERTQPILADVEPDAPGTAVAMLDIDLFKAINDRHGHDIGDRTLVAVADRLRAITRKSDCIARWGGEEFVVLMPEISLEEAAATAERIRIALADTSIALDDGGSLRFTASIGVAGAAKATDINELIRTADFALYGAKQAGRDRVVTAATTRTHDVPISQNPPQSSDIGGTAREPD